ncbi:MAG: penicillin acylase family protein [Pirellulaceae bacterium]|nr:penicillin acylase family protein [Pirellulaceae bacterium]
MKFAANVLNRKGLCCLATLAWCVSCLSTMTSRAAEADAVSLPGLSAPVQVYLDQYAIPHVYAGSWTDAARVMGYLHASGRLWQMDMLRRQASGNLAEIMGPDGLPADTLMRQLGIRRDCEALWKSNDIPDAMRAELEAYAAGVNHRIAELGKDGLPMAFQAMGYAPAPWSPVDSLVFSKYMGWDQSGTMDDLWFGSVVEKMGATALEQLWPLDRPYEQSTISVQSSRATSLGSAAFLNPASSSSTRAGDSHNIGYQPPSENEVGGEGLSQTYLNLFDRLNNIGWFGRGSSFGSNNWAVDGSKTQSGKPMVCSDPHLGFSIPSIWYTAHINVGDQNVAGVTFPGSHTVVIGHNDHIAWGLTNMQADAVDYYIETVDPQNPRRYLHRGQWKEMTRIVESIPVRGSESHELVIDSTVHGPVVHQQPATISLCWTGLGPTTDPVAFWELSRARDLNGYLSALDKLQVPAMNIVYGDVYGNIAMHCCGRLPLRTRGQGRTPMDGSTGLNDWNGWIARDQLPLSINPPEHFVASANGRPHPLGYPHYLGWMWDPSYRTRRIKNVLTEAKSLTIETMKPIQYDHFDGAASQFLPAMLPALKDRLDAKANPQLLAAAAAALRDWDYMAGTDAIGPTIWLHWLEKYRDNVWQDEWPELGIEPQGGSWGFCGDNRREPMLEVLEYLTREMPESVWFDDRRTAERENRDIILRRSFVEAVESLAARFGTDLNQWQWQNINVLKIESLSGVADLNVDGGPVVGTSFTLNPGGNVGHVGGGASWRMIVDFGKVSSSVGVYPGGQSEDPASAHYADQVPLWATGQYTPLNMHTRPADLPVAAKTKVISFK